MKNTELSNNLENDNQENKEDKNVKNEKMSEIAKKGKGVSRIKLGTAQEIRKFLAKITRDVQNDNIPYEKARLLMLLCESLLKAHRLDEVEKRMMDLEQLLNDRNDSKDIDLTADFFLKKAK